MPKAERRGDISITCTLTSESGLSVIVFTAFPVSNWPSLASEVEVFVAHPQPHNNIPPTAINKPNIFI